MAKCIWTEGRTQCFISLCDEIVRYKVSKIYLRFLSKIKVKYKSVTEYNNFIELVKANTQDSQVRQYKIDVGNLAGPKVVNENSHLSSSNPSFRR